MITDIIKKLKPFLADDRKHIAEKTSKVISMLQAKKLFANAYQAYDKINEPTKTKILMEISNIQPNVGFDFINKALDDENPRVRALAIKATIELNEPRLIQKIAKLVNDVDPTVRKLAYEYLGLYPLPQVASFLNKKLLDEDDKEALSSLIKSTGNIGNPESVNYLFKILEKYNDDRLIELTIEALGKIKL
jgi:HEAT repeat protein